MEHNEKELEQLINKLMKEDSLEEPSLEFTDKVMLSIESDKATSPITTYEPLISGRAWAFIALCICTILSVIYFNKESSSSGFISSLEWSKFNFNPFSTIELDFSLIMTYALGFFALMLIVQASVLKSYFNSRLNY